MKKRAVFFDRDGVLVRALVREGKAYSPRSLEEFDMVPEAAAAVAEIKSAGFELFIVTNQPDISRGKLKAEVLESLHASLLRELGGAAMIREIRVCPHDDHEGCKCRKPAPGMLTDLAQRYEIDLGRSFMVGDREVDLLAGEAAGCRTILIDAEYNCGVEAEVRVPDLKSACRKILELSR